MASVILTVLYPEDFTVYDIRVCNIINDFFNLGNITNFSKLWTCYLLYKRKMIDSSPKELSLRDKDRYLWGKSFCEHFCLRVATEKCHLRAKRYMQGIAKRLFVINIEFCYNKSAPRPPAVLGWLKKWRYWR